MTVKKYIPGDIIIKQNAKNNMVFYILLSGSVESELI